MSTENPLYTYLLRLGDNALILGQRLAEWCGHGPVLEEDIAMTNLSLDLIGQATQLLEYAGKVSGDGSSADDLAFYRDAPEFRNVILTEQPNGDFAHTMLRHFFFSSYADLLYRELNHSADEHLRGIAGKSSKEMGYHYRHSRDWVIRMGDGTDESKRRIEAALDWLWSYSGEMFEDDEVEQTLHDAEVIPLNLSLKAEWMDRVRSTLEEAGLSMPEDCWMQTGGRHGRHSEHLGHLLSELQFMQRAYPGLQW